jgi:hypothetical protein
VKLPRWWSAALVLGLVAAVVILGTVLSATGR